MKKILLTLVLGILLLGTISAVCPDGAGYLGSKKQDTCVRISQTCATCSFVTLSSITLTKSNQSILSNTPMVDFGDGEWVYQFCDTTDLGSYDVRGVGDINGKDTSFTSCFDITPSGNSGTSNIVFFVFIILIIYGVALFGFFGKNIPMTIIGGMALMFLGVYMINQGIIIYRDTLTNYFSYLTTGLGFIFVSWALLEEGEFI